MMEGETDDIGHTYAAALTEHELHVARAAEDRSVAGLRRQR